MTFLLHNKNMAVLCCTHEGNGVVLCAVSGGVILEVKNKTT